MLPPSLDTLLCRHSDMHARTCKINGGVLKVDWRDPGANKMTVKKTVGEVSVGVFRV